MHHVSRTEKEKRRNLISFTRCIALPFIISMSTMTSIDGVILFDNIFPISLVRWEIKNGAYVSHLMKTALAPIRVSRSIIIIIIVIIQRKTLIGRDLRLQFS